MADVRITLPGNPRGKGRPRATIRGGRVSTYTDEKTRSFEGALRLAGEAAMAGRPPMIGQVVVDVRATLPIPGSWPKKRQEAALSGAVRPTGKPDADNLLKVLDALNGVVFKDDSQIVRAVIEKHYGAFPGLCIEAREI